MYSLVYMSIYDCINMCISASCLGYYWSGGAQGAPDREAGEGNAGVEKEKGGERAGRLTLTRTQSDSLTHFASLYLMQT